MKKVQIFLRKSPKDLPSWCYDEFGRVAFEVGNLKLSKSKKAEQLNEFNQLTSGGILGFRIEASDKNKLILKAYGCASFIGFNHKAKIPVIVREAGRTLRQNMLAILRKNRDGWEIELTDGSEFWKEALAGFAMCDIPYEDVVLNEAFLRDNWANQARYQDGANGLWFPLIHYGNWNFGVLRDSNGNITQEAPVRIADFRPWIHVLGALQKGFCAVGYEFISPILQSDEMRHWIAYVLRDLENMEDIPIGFRASTSTDVSYQQLSTINLGGADIFAHWVQFDDDATGLNFDTAQSVGAGYFDPSPGNHFAHGLSGVHDLEVCINLNLTQTAQAIIFVVQDASPSSPNTVTAGQFTEVAISPTFSIDPGQTQLCFTYRDVPIIALRYLRVYVNLAGISVQPSEVIEAGSYIRNSSKKFEIGENAILPISRLLDCNLSFLDFFAGILHALGGGKIVTDVLAKRITLYHRDEITLRDGSSPEAFFNRRRVVQGTPIICDSEEVDIKQSLDKRYYRLKFKDPEDARVKDLGYSAENPLHGRVIDLGEGLEEDTTEDANPVFEATSMIKARGLLNPPATFQGADVDTDILIPALWDNTDFKISTNLKPRLMFVAGLIQQYRGVNDLGSPVLAEWAFQRDLNNPAPTESPENFIPYAYHLNTELIGPDSANLIPLDNHIVYGSESLDLYELFWKQKILAIGRSIDVQYQILIDVCTFDGLEFRKLWEVIYQGKKYLAE
ncbi:MAG: hypothetical protein AAF391_06805, partial [Bacteroidota bacterium]